MAFARPLSALLLLVVVAPHFNVATGFLGQLLACSAFLLLNGAVPRDPRSRRLVLAAAGLSGALLWAVADSQWVLVLLAFAIHAGVHRLRFAEAALLGLAGLVPAALLLVLVIGGSHESVHALLRSLTIALPETNDAIVLAVMLAAASFLARLATQPGDTPPRDPTGKWLGAAFAAVTLATMAARASDTLRAALFIRGCRIWSEAPALLDVLKWQTGSPIFGPRNDVNSFVYSPVSELVSWAILAPFGKSLSLPAHRVVVLAWQTITIVLFAAAVAVTIAIRMPRDRRATWTSRAPVVLFAAVIAAVLWSSPVSPYLHPDHAMNACVAAAALLLVAEPRIPRRAFVAALFLLPVVAVSFKLTAAGLGVGLVLALGCERRFRDVGVLVLSGLAALGTIPLFNAAFGPYSGYTLDLLAHHVLHPERWWKAMVSPWGRVMVGSSGAALLISRGTASEKNVRRVLVIIGAVGSFASVARA